MATDDNRPLLRVSDMARELRLSQSRIYGLIHAGAIPATRVGGRLVVPRAAWSRWLEQRADEALATISHDSTEAPRP
jgi:excisionase family DNA binding protein